MEFLGLYALHSSYFASYSIYVIHIDLSGYYILLIFLNGKIFFLFNFFFAFFFYIFLILELILSYQF